MTVANTFAYPLPLPYVAQIPLFLLFIPIDVQDTEQRPLMEWRSIRHRENLGSDLRVCPFPGARMGHANGMNVRSLRAVKSHQTFVDACLATLCAYIKRGSPLESDFSLRRYGLISFAGSSISAFIAFSSYRRACFVPTIPAEVAVVEKICRGLLTGYFNVDSTKGDLLKIGDFAEMIDRSEALIGRTQVCAGSPGQILQTLSVFALSETDLSQHSNKAKIDDYFHVVDLYKFSEVSCSAHFFCLLFETMRFRAWIDFNRSRRAATQFSDATQPRSRWALPTCDVAEQLARSEDPFGGLLAKQFALLPGGSVKSEGEACLALAADALSAGFQEERWAAFRDRLFVNLNRLNEQLKLLFPAQSWKQDLQSHDFLQFFGPTISSDGGV